MTKPYRGETTETSNLDRIIQQILNPQLSSLNPPIGSPLCVITILGQ